MQILSAGLLRAYAEKEKKAETHSIIAVGSDIKSLTQQITGKMELSSTYPVFSFDAKV